MYLMTQTWIGVVQVCVPNKMRVQKINADAYIQKLG